MKLKKYFLIIAILLNIFFINNKVFATTNLSQPSDNGAYYSNLSGSFQNTSAADPTIVEGPDGCFYVFATNRTAYKSCDSVNWTWWSYNINGSLPSHDYFWAPEIHKINGYYYMLFTLVKWGSGYPWATDSFGSVYYARSTDLVNFEYLGEVPFGSDYFNGKTTNKNHIDGSLLLDGGRIYFYYKLEDRDVPADYQSQQIYGMELGLDGNGRFYAKGNPTVVMRKNTESTPLHTNNFTWHCWQDGNYAADTENINEGPYVIKKDGKYFLTFSVGEYTNDSYHVIAATSSSPLGPYIRDKMSSTNPLNENQPNIRDFASGANYPSTAATDGSRNSNNNIYGTGHGSILTLTNYDSLVGYYTDYYYAYHSNKYSGGTFTDRKLTIDSVNFSGGVMYLNGPTTTIQPLITGSYYNGVNYFKIPSNKYSINEGILSDGLRYSSKNMGYGTTNTNTIKISFNHNERVSLIDIWVYGNGQNFGKVTGTLYINEGTGRDYKVKFNAKVSGSVAKIQLPNINEKVKNVRVVFDSNLTLSEVELIRTSQDNYYLFSYNSNGGSNVPSTIMTYGSGIYNRVAPSSRSGYKFLGWFTSDGVQVYNADGGFNVNAGVFNGDGIFVYTNDLTLYARWEKTSSSSSNPSTTPSNPGSSTTPSNPGTTTPSNPESSNPNPLSPLDAIISLPIEGQTGEDSTYVEPTYEDPNYQDPTFTYEDQTDEDNEDNNQESINKVNVPTQDKLTEFLFSNPLIIGLVVIVIYFGEKGLFALIKKNKQ